MIYKLENFGDLLDVGVAFNLLYYVFDKVHQSWTTVYEDKINETLKECRLIEEKNTTDNSDTKTENNYFEKKSLKDLDSIKNTSNKITKFLKGIALFATLILVILLSLLGYDPAFSINLCWSVILIVFLIFDVPVGLIILMVFWHWNTRKLTEQLKQHKEIIEEEKEGAYNKLDRVKEKK